MIDSDTKWVKPGSTKFHPNIATTKELIALADDMKKQWFIEDYQPVTGYGSMPPYKVFRIGNMKFVPYVQPVAFSY